MNTASIKDFITNVLTPLIAVVTSVFVLINKQQTDKIDKDLAELNKLARSQEIQLSKLNQERDFHFKVYDLLTKAMEDTNSRKLNVAIAFIKASIEEEDFRNALLQAVIYDPRVKDSIKTELTQQIKTAQIFEHEEQKIDDYNHEDSNLRIDVFYFEENKENSKAKAEKFASLLRKNHKDVRVRMLPELVNINPGYRINSNQIRYNTDEEELANQLKEELKGLDSEIYPKIVRQHTPNYLSVFVYQ